MRRTGLWLRRVATLGGVPWNPLKSGVASSPTGIAVSGQTGEVWGGGASKSILVSPPGSTLPVVTGERGTWKPLKSASGWPSGDHTIWGHTSAACCGDCFSRSRFSGVILVACSLFSGDCPFVFRVGFCSSQIAGAISKGTPEWAADSFGSYP